MRRPGVPILLLIAALGLPLAALHADTLLPPPTALTESAPVASARFGSVIAVGDVNGDGIDDVVTSATGPGAGSGEIHVRIGPSLGPGPIISNPDGASSFGTSLALGDINNDGFDDVIAGALGATVAGQIGAGQAWVFYGPAFSTSTRLVDPEPQAAAAFGVSVGAGDTNGDGHDEVIVGAWDSNIPPYIKSGQAFVFSGPSLTAVQTLQSPAPQNIGDFGVATAIGDFDGDGFGDAIVGSWISDVVEPGDDAGQVFVFRGPAFSEVTALRDAASGGRLGQSVAIADTDGDGAGEVIAGARGGAVVFDATVTSYTSMRIRLPDAWLATTTAVAAGDVTGDGLADIAIGAPNAAPGGDVTGAALFVPASAAGRRYTIMAPSPESGARFGAAIALAGGEVLAGSPYADLPSAGDGGVAFRSAIADGDTDGALDIDDNCAAVSNPGQENADADFIDLSPVKAFDDLTWPNSDGIGDACDADDDNDGRADVSELAGSGCGGFTSPTDPLDRDSDGDRFLDGAECMLDTNPADANSRPSITACGDTSDTDGDGLLVRAEVCLYNTNPSAADTDGDGCGDGREAASVNADRIVNALDLSQVAQSFGPSTGPAYLADLDYTRDGQITAIDLSQVARQFGAC